MKTTIAATILATALASTTLVATTAVQAAAEDGYTQICWANPADLIHHAVAIEPGDDTSYLAGMIVRPFPQNALGCASYDGTPLQDWETLYPGTPAEPVVTCVPVEVVRTVEVTDPNLVAKVARQRAKITHLRAVIRSLRNR